MKPFSRLFAGKSLNANTAAARRRMEKSMPGEAAALASLRLGGYAL